MGDKAKELGDPWPAMFDVLHALLIERKSQLTNGRVNAFLHRIMTTAVRLTKKHQQESTAYVLGLLLIVRAVLISHRYKISTSKTPNFEMRCELFRRRSGAELTSS